MSEEKILKKQPNLPHGLVKVHKQKFAYKDDLDHVAKAFSYEIVKLKKRVDKLEAKEKTKR
jgi:hypothetical protein